MTYSQDDASDGSYPSRPIPLPTWPPVKKADPPATADDEIAGSRDPFFFRGSVGRFGENRRDDVIKAQILLGNAGIYDLASLGAPTGWPGAELERAIRKYQKAKGLDVDGIMLPANGDGVDESGVGETLFALRDELGGRLNGYAAPTPEEVDAHYDERARRIARGEEDSSQPISTIVTANEGGTTPYLIGMIPPGATATDAPPPQPPQFQPGQQMAYLRSQADLLGGMKVMPEGGGGGGGFATGGGAAALTGLLGALLGRDSEKAKEPTPEPTPEPPPADLDAARMPDPAQPEDDKAQADQAAQPPRRGRIVVAGDGREVHVPPLGAWADDLDDKARDFAESFNAALHLEIGKHGGSRGGLWTQQELQIIAKTCTELAQQKLPDFYVEHVAGTYDPKDNRLTEEQMWQYDENGNRIPAGFRRPDISIELARNIVLRMRINSTDIYADGTNKPREQRAAEDIQAMSPYEPMLTIGKSKPGTDEETIKEAARKACGDAIDDLIARLERDGEFKKPKPDVRPKYKGPANEQKAKEIKKLLDGSSKSIKAPKNLH